MTTSLIPAYTAMTTWLDPRVRGDDDVAGSPRTPAGRGGSIGAYAQMTSSASFPTRGSGSYRESIGRRQSSLIFAALITFAQRADSSFM